MFFCLFFFSFSDQWRTGTSLYIIPTTRRISNQVQTHPGESGKWQAHLRGASPRMQTLARARSQSPEYDPADEMDHDGLGTSSGEHAEDETAIDFLVRTFVALDVFVCASARSSPFLGIDHDEILGTISNTGEDTDNGISDSNTNENTDKRPTRADGVDLKTTLGCENWVVDEIFAAVRLDAWKRDAQRGCRQ